MLAVH
ncbi:hypothetical protein AOCH_007712 [Aspergillus ochraceoroseus]